MPSPVFIVCSEGGSVDRHTNQLSIFDVVEKLTFRRIESPEPPPAGTAREIGLETKPMSINVLRMTAYWRRDDGDTGAEFDFKTTLKMPGVAEEITAGEGRFLFKTELHRLLSTMYTNMPDHSGEIVVRNSIRRAGTNDWLSQQYVIPVERIDGSANQTTIPLS